MQGWIKLHRKLLCSDIFQNEKLLKVFLYCLLKASHQDRTAVVGLQKVELKQGQFIFGRSKAASELNMKESTVWKHVKFLEAIDSISLKSNNKFTIVTIDKWGEYQGFDETEEQQSDNKVTTKEQQSNTDNNVNNGKKNNYPSHFEEWWNLYPRKVEKKKAYSSFKTALKNNSFEVLLEGVRGYVEYIKQNKVEEKFIKHPTTFLNGESFKDYLKKPGTVNKPMNVGSDSISSDGLFEF